MCIRDSIKKQLPFSVTTNTDSIILKKGETETVTLGIDYLSNIAEINFNSAHTASTVTTSSDILVSHTMNQSNEITVYVTASDFALSGDYKLLLGIFNSDVNVSKYIDVTIKP